MTPDLQRIVEALKACRERYVIGANPDEYDWCVSDRQEGCRVVTGPLERCQDVIDARCAEAMVRAIREPSDKMGAAGVRVQVAKSNPEHPSAMSEAGLEAVGFRDCLHGNPSRWMKPVWRAMCDAILGETQP
jgi:hypothetical protein